MSLGNDFTTIRKEKNLSLEDIFEVTKIPVHTLKSIENDTLLKSSTESITYLRSFIRSYAKALKIPDTHILTALKATEDGTYDHDLIKLVDPESFPESYSVKKDTVEIENPKKIEPEGLKADTYQEEIQSSEEKVVKSELEKKDSVAPTVDTINWADMSKKVYASPTNSKLGLLLIVILIIGGLGAASFFYGGDLLSMFSSEENSTPQETVDGPGNTSQDPFAIIDDSTSTNNENLVENEGLNTTPTSLPETLTVTLYAAYDKLEPVRVTSDLNGRTNPFWMNQGEAYYFDFKDSLRVRGQYSRFLLMYNGNVINNPRQNNFDPNFDSIVLTREVLSAPQYQQNAQNSFPDNLGIAPPDSIVYRIEF
ncbi:MAG: helix-turn-helix transcriptional regulator [Balneola sp.]